MVRWYLKSEFRLIYLFTDYVFKGNKGLSPGGQNFSRAVVVSRSEEIKAITDQWDSRTLNTLIAEMITKLLLIIAAGYCTPLAQGYLGRAYTSHSKGL